MDKLHSTMVNACDRLLALLTGPRAAIDSSETAAVLEAIELLRVLEGYLKGTAENTVIDDSMLESFTGRARVSHHIADVLGVLHEQGMCRPLALRHLNA